MQARSLSALLLLVSIGLCSCGGGQGDAKSADSQTMSAPEARKYIESLGEKKTAPPVDPKSMDEVFTILRQDDIRRFEGATRFTEGMQGVEGLSVRATIELMSADIYATVAALVEELARRSLMEIERLREKEKSGVVLSEGEKEELSKLEERGERLGKAGTALDVLADEHRSAGGALAQEAVKQYPKDPSGYHAAAYYHLLDNNWLRYDDMMSSLEGANIDDAGMSYFRALESLYRNMDREQTRVHLREALEKNPRLVRAQAELVLVQDDIDSRHVELMRLKEMKADHPIVNIAGPAIESEFEVTTAIRGARGAPSADDSEAATSSQEPPAPADEGNGPPTQAPVPEPSKGAADSAEAPASPAAE